MVRRNIYTLGDSPPTEIPPLPELLAEAEEIIQHPQDHAYNPLILLQLLTHLTKSLTALTEEFHSHTHHESPPDPPKKTRKPSPKSLDT